MQPSNNIYTSLCVLFAVFIVTGNLIYQKFVTIPLLPFHSFEVSSGAILYPLTFLLTDLITEFYGKEKAYFCVKLGLMMNITVSLFIAFINYLEATPWSKIDNATFNFVFGMFGVSFIASIIACYIAQRVDVIIYSWIRKSTKGHYLWLRSIGSTGISLLIDTAIVNTILSVFNILPAERLGSIILNSYLYKLFFTVSSTPLFYMCVKGIKRLTKGNRISQKLKFLES